MLCSFFQEERMYANQWRTTVSSWYLGPNSLWLKSFRNMSSEWRRVSHDCSKTLLSSRRSQVLRLFFRRLEKVGIACPFSLVNQPLDELRKLMSRILVRNKKTVKGNLYQIFVLKQPQMQEALYHKWKEHNQNKPKECMNKIQIKNKVKSQQRSNQIPNKFVFIMSLVIKK